MRVLELLAQRKHEALAQIQELESEIREIDRMLGSSKVPLDPEVAFPTADASVPYEKMSQEDQIFSAIKAGNHRPVDIFNHINKVMGLKVNNPSVRTRLTRMKSAGKLKLDARGWDIVDNGSQPGSK